MFTTEKNVLVLVALLKAHNVDKIIASPGSANSPFVATVQRDPYFEVISCIDERSAAYMACGIYLESGRPVAISCTGATASRNYLPGLTEAYYRKYPIIAITSTKPVGKVGHHIAQVIDRSSFPKDCAKESLLLPVIKDDESRWECEMKINRGILNAINKLDPGPVHFNLETSSENTYNIQKLPEVRVINRIFLDEELPELKYSKVVIFIGSTKQWNIEEKRAIEDFCAKTGAVVMGDHTSGYKGKYFNLFSIVRSQDSYDRKYDPELLIYVGEVSGDYSLLSMRPKEVWRVNPDGVLRDTFKNLKYVFQCSEKDFFEHYSRNISYLPDTSYAKAISQQLNDLRKNIPDLPFSNIYIAQQLSPRIPIGSNLHFSILNSLRAWNLFEVHESIKTSCNVGGFGIDGCMSTLIGSSIINKEKLNFLIIGDLAFFYDLNSIGNRHIGSNLRILLINNGKGVEFNQYKHHTSHFGEETNYYISAAGHNGSMSRTLLKEYVESLSFEYMSARNKEEFKNNFDSFISTKKSTSIIFECFIDPENDPEAMRLIATMNRNTLMELRNNSKKIVKSLLKRK